MSAALTGNASIIRATPQASVTGTLGRELAEAWTGLQQVMISIFGQWGMAVPALR
ncbi:hypothetical protein [Niveispirillum sp. SYP-B3756]|uniref:hypothetical protein n=1 Tax=Niveispirillum sp. SYP-B3756 TaxID=2662178 RepID=UPI001563BE92|nr:hypothetical protein [Niveispirillum sp. SYP-B3756]